MSSFEWPDLSRLALQARDQKLDVRPILLRVHTDLFVAAPGRDRATVQAFEALALGFLPIVDDATATEVARKLATIDDTPRTIVDALIRRGGAAREAILGKGETAQDADATARRTSVAPTVEPRSPDDKPVEELRPPEDLDLTLAGDRRARIGGAQLRELVERGRERPQLARALLARGDLSAGDEALLYLHANNARRAEIRSKLEPLVALASRGQSRLRADQGAVAALLGFTQALDIRAFEAQLARMLHLDPAPDWRFAVEPRRELLALALVAAGVSPEDCIRIYLTFHPAVSRSVSTVFHLAQIARSVPQPLALYLVEAVLDVVVEAKPEGRYVPAADPSPAPLRDRHPARRQTLTQIRAAVLARRAG